MHRLAWLLLLGIGCQAGGIHKRGESQISVLGEYADTFRDHPVWGIARGSATNYGVSANYKYFFRDRWAAIAAFTPIRVFDQAGEDANAIEFRLGVHTYPLDFKMGKIPTTLFFEAMGGRMQADEHIPPRGSKGNWTQDFGVGFEWRVRERTSWLLGYRVRHFSNGGGSSLDNPSQNEHVVFTGIGFSW